MEVDSVPKAALGFPDASDCEAIPSDNRSSGRQDRRQVSQSGQSSGGEGERQERRSPAQGGFPASGSACASVGLGAVTQGVGIEGSQASPEARESGEKVVLKWKRVKNAAKYHLYVSDDEEILIDEFETQEETFYILKKTLDPQKTYKWKVVVTLENGNTIMGYSQKFTVKDIQQNLKKFDKNMKPVVRCTANN